MNLCLVVGKRFEHGVFVLIHHVFGQFLAKRFFLETRKITDGVLSKIRPGTFKIFKEGSL